MSISSVTARDVLTRVRSFAWLRVRAFFCACVRACTITGVAERELTRGQFLRLGFASVKFFVNLKRLSQMGAPFCLFVSDVVVVSSIVIRIVIVVVLNDVYFFIYS